MAIKPVSMPSKTTSSALSICKTRKYCSEISVYWHTLGYIDPAKPGSDDETLHCQRVARRNLCLLDYAC
jgi:hypothetical protein